MNESDMRELIKKQSNFINLLAEGIRESYHKSDRDEALEVMEKSLARLNELAQLALTPAV